MKNIMKTISIFSVLLCCAGCNKDENNNVSGIVHETHQEALIQGNKDLEHGHYKSLTIQGNADLEDVTVTKTLKVQGNLEAEDCFFHNVIVQGKSEMEDTKVSGTTQVFGFAEFDESKLQAVEVHGEKTVFEECSVASIHMKEHSKQLVILKDTVVNGNVLFDKSDGEVKLKGSSEVKGKIIGGIVKK